MSEQESKLHEEIIAEARSKAEHQLARARNEADAVLEAARKAAREKREARLKEARELAAKRSHAIVSGVELETTRRWLQKQEACIDAELNQALAEAEAVTGARREDALRQLAREALQAIGDVSCTVTVSPADSSLVTPDWLSAIMVELYPESKSTFTVAPDNAIRCGVVVASDDGRKSFDNTCRRRLERLRDQLRLLLADGVYEDGGNK